jgi:hopanoid biosynthesis associated protein HpnK
VTPLILTADDFGLAVEVNMAVEFAHRAGRLSCASLMVTAPAAADAVQRARAMPDLGVGLHITLVEGRPALPPDEIPDLVGDDGQFLDDPFAAGLRFFFRHGARRQLRAEIRAQFDTFAATGLALDHVNTHNHLHLHPTVLGVLLEVARSFGQPPVRLPREPMGAAASAGAGALAARIAMAPILALVQARLSRAGVRHNGQILGISHSGHMDEARILALLNLAKSEPTELYLHPATGRARVLDRTMADYEHAGELAALLSPALEAAIEAKGFRLSRFRDLA